MPSGPSYDVPVTQIFSNLDCRSSPQLILTLFRSFKTRDSIFLLDLTTLFLSVFIGLGVECGSPPHGDAAPRADVFTGITRRFL